MLTEVMFAYIFTFVYNTTLTSTQAVIWSCALDPRLPHLKCDSLIQKHLEHSCTL